MSASSSQSGQSAGFIIAIFVFVAALPQVARSDPAQDLFRTPAAGSTEVVDHAPWDQLLQTYVKPGADGLNRVDYAAVKADGLPALRSYIRTLEQVDPASLDRNEQFAFLANLYNAKTLEIVASRYPVKSIRDISLGGGVLAALGGGPWKAKVLKIQGVELSLDDIEHGIMRPVFKDPRVHYAVNCASIGCPNLPTEAFTGAKLSQQLDSASRDYVNSSRGVRFENGRPVISSIYVWYQDDFGGTDQGVLDHLRRYASPPLERRLANVKSIGKDAYDWGLNDASP
jgi:hypothetical protein